MFENELHKLRTLYNSGLFIPEFYSKKIKSETSFSNYDEFQKVPFTYKDELRTSSVMERTTTDIEDIYGVFSSSGTTGNKTFYVYNKNDKKVHEEFVKTFFEELKVTAEDLGGIMAPVDTGVMAHTMMWEFTTVGAGYINCPQPSPENIALFVEQVPITIIATRPNVATNVVYDKDASKKAFSSKVNKLLLGGGFLSKQRRLLLEKTWNAQCYNLFGMSEMFGPMAAECKQKNGLHYLDKYLMIEIIDPETLLPVKEGEIGVAVYTTLWEKGFPLLRYWTDDLMRIEKKKCECGSELPRLFYLGRLADHFKTEIGKYVFPENVEDILFANGLYGDYEVEFKNDDVIVKTETMHTVATEFIKRDLDLLFEKNSILQFVEPKSLGYTGHGNRFKVTK